MSDLRRFLSHCGTVASAGLLIGGLALVGAVPGGLGGLGSVWVPHLLLPQHRQVHRMR